MEDENEKKEEDQPSTSKKESPEEELSENSRRDRRGTPSVNSESSFSRSRSRVNVTEADWGASKPVNFTKRGREPKTQVRKRKVARRTGRVEKRQRSYSRRQTKRFSRRRPRIKQEFKSQHSVNTIFTRLSSKSGDSRVQLCANCGHRCCRRRTEIIQVGSRCATLSPLFVSPTLDPVTEEEAVNNATIPYGEVTPQIIYDSLRKLSVWRQYVMTGDLMDYVRRTYPVNQVESELYDELKEKLRVAAIAGIVIEPYEDNWCLACALKERQLTPNHVTLFWEAYVDTINPLQKSRPRVKEAESSDPAMKQKK